MRVMSMHKSNKESEADLPPSPEVMAGMWPLIQEMTAAGVFVSGEGLRPSATGVRLTFAQGQRTITKGPFVGGNELLAGFCIVKVKTIDEAIEWATRFAGLVGDTEIDVRPVTETWDLGMMPRPEGVETTRFMLTHKANARSESGAPPDPALVAKLQQLTEEMKQAGVFLAAEGLRPSSQGVRLYYTGGTQRMVDGPFIESKELIAGYSIMEVASIDEAVEWSARFARLIGDIEIDIRLMY